MPVDFLGGFDECLDFSRDIYPCGLEDPFCVAVFLVALSCIDVVLPEELKDIIQGVFVLCLCTQEEVERKAYKFVVEVLGDARVFGVFIGAVKFDPGIKA